MSTLSAPNHLTTTGTKQRPCDNCSPPLPPLPTPAPTPRPTPTPTLPPLPTPVIMIYERRHPATTADINIDRRHKTIDQFTCRSNSIRTRYAAHNNVITDRPMTHALTVSVNIQRSHLSHVLYGSKLARRFFVLIRTTCYKCVIIASIDNRLRGTISKTPAPPPPPCRQMTPGDLITLTASGVTGARLDRAQRFITLKRECTKRSAAPNRIMVAKIYTRATAAAAATA